ncbi:hypothetical protein GGD56_004845 [Rhizobium mongolense]|uniref:Uncharacterized protein n=1 Tax=Rhizobium mongolense TaxID=57676 RepID=A0A7W6RUH7_9HYPH|nr:hypothetical protein [Rhizobium mongolense]MBB4278860.1 hypothetical protein [Rhizobium mongolense]
MNDERVQAVVVLFENFKQLPPHARLPVFVDMRRNTLSCVAFRLALEKGRNLVGHVDEL